MKPVSDQEKERLGTLRSDRKRGDVVTSDEPLPKRPPKILCDDGRSVWREVRKHCDWLRESHALCLTMYCSHMAEWRKATRKLNADGLVYETTTREGNKRIYRRPEVSIRKQAATLIRGLSRQLGLSPRDCQGLGQAKTQEGDGFDAYLMNGKECRTG